MPKRKELTTDATGRQFSMRSSVASGVQSAEANAFDARAEHNARAADERLPSGSAKEAARAKKDAAFKRAKTEDWYAAHPDKIPADRYQYAKGGKIDGCAQRGKTRGGR